MSARLRDKYQQEVVPALKKEFGYANVMAVPRIQKVVVNMGLGEATSNAKLVDVGADELARITEGNPVHGALNDGGELEGVVRVRARALDPATPRTAAEEAAEQSWLRERQLLAGYP